MNKSSSDINWSEIESPLSTALFEKYTQQLIHSPIEKLGLDPILWSQCRTFALNLSKQGFIDPISILYTSFKRYYSSKITYKAFTRWLLLDELNKNEFKINSLCYSTFQSASQINKMSSDTIKQINFINPLTNIEQIWFLFSISMLIPANSYILIPEIAMLDNDITRLSISHKRSNASRLHCIFAITPSGKYSNQLIICKPSRTFKVNCSSTSFTRIIQSSTGDVTCEYVQQWLDDFLQSSYVTKNSALLLDPRTTLLTQDFSKSCEQSNIEILTTDLDSYITHIVSPFFSLFDKQWSEANRIDSMHLKPVGFLQRIIHRIWFSLRTLKQNEQISKIFNQTILWKTKDQEYIQSIQPPTQNILPKKKKKKLLIKTSKSKLSSTPMMTDPPIDSTPEQILSYILNRQISISRASKYLGGMKLDYFKYCLSYKMNSSLITGSHLIQLNTFMQSNSTVNWLRHLRSLYFWPCAKQLFLREIYQLTGIITRKRSMNICGNNNMGSIRSCDLQSPGIFWRAFEDLHQIQLDNEIHIDDKQWNEDFQHYLIDKKLDHNKTQLWTIDTFEFPLTKNSTILQLPEWNELRPMNLTSKVTVIYAFSNDGQSIEPYFIFPNSLSDKTLNNEQDSYNDLGHLTPQIFQYWIEKYFLKKDNDHHQQQQQINPIVLIFCSRLPILSSTVLSYLEQNKIYPFGYPFQRTLPFRYLFERRVRNNRSTNLMSELWKKKLLDEQRTHVLKGTNCTVKNIKYYFQQIWPLLINEKRDDDEDNKTFKDKCQQAFQQANIQLIIENNFHTDSNELMDELKHLLNVIGYVKESINPTQILKIKNNDSLASKECSETNGTSQSSSSESSSESTNETNIPTTSDKRSGDENDEPPSSKRLRSSFLQLNNSITTTNISQWIPPSKPLVTNLQSQSSSIFQFILSLVNTILTSSEYHHLTDEHYQWLITTINHYDKTYNIDKLNFLIEIACIVVKTDFVR